MSHDIHDDHGPIENVCMTGGAAIGGFILGLVITAIIFWWAFVHH